MLMFYLKQYFDMTHNFRTNTERFRGMINFAISDLYLQYNIVNYRV
jgi:hypothetical protein